MPDAEIAAELQRITDRLVAALQPLRFSPPVTHVYNPLDYAAAPYSAYLQRYARRRPDAVLLGMNPGPFGMAQTGVPFGDVGMVTGWLGIREPVGKPAVEHPKRPILGLELTRSEVSGARLWGWARDTFGTPERFFDRFFVANYCPLSFMEASGRNRTPDKLPAGERSALMDACDRALRDTVRALDPGRVIGVGAFAERRAREVLDGVPIGRILHPSPASPLANRGWAAAATAELRAQGVEVVDR
jgi:single-strand selective monofunctional uracil DNA glycosylase